MFWCSTGTFGSVCHAHNASGQDVAIKVFTLFTDNKPGFSAAMRRCSAEFELLQQIPSNVGLVHRAGPLITMETTSTTYYVAIPMNFCSHVPFEVCIHSCIDVHRCTLCDGVWRWHSSDRAITIPWMSRQSDATCLPFVIVSANCTSWALLIGTCFGLTC